MAKFVLDDAREYVFCLFLGREDEYAVVLQDSLEYLGTAFFVSKKGDAITAAHVIPPDTSLDADQHLYAISIRDGKTQVYRVLMAAVFEESDLAICRVNVNDNPYLKVSFARHSAGTDVVTIGIPEHEVYQSGKELRILKGHITLAAKPHFSELNFAIPRGMSGGPVIEGTKCIGFLSANIRSESLEDQVEEIEELENGKEKITLIESKSIINFGIFIPFSYFQGHKSDVFEGRSLDELLQQRNSS